MKVSAPILRAKLLATQKSKLLGNNSINCNYIVMSLSNEFIMSLSYNFRFIRRRCFRTHY